MGSMMWGLDVLSQRQGVSSGFGYTEGIALRVLLLLVLVVGGFLALELCSDRPLGRHLDRGSNGGSCDHKLVAGA